MTSSPAIEAEHLVKHFGETVAVDGVSLSVPEGTVLGMLGPNGAGKTTTVRMLTTMSLPTSGTGRAPAAGTMVTVVIRPPPSWSDRSPAR